MKHLNNYPDKLRPECIKCLVSRYAYKYPDTASDTEKVKYSQKVLRTISDAKSTMSAPEIVNGIYKIQRDIFGSVKDYTEIKKHYNEFMMKLLPEMTEETEASDDPLKHAVRIAMTANYIDFSALNNVNENDLKKLLLKADNNPIEDIVLENLRQDILNADKMAYLTDNCGEIVADKLLISVIRTLNPNLDITVIVRGGDVVNDATLSDADQVGISEVAKVMGNGTDIAGTCLDRISPGAKRTIEEADIIISKGQGNYETISQSGLNVYYIFMCKCEMFIHKFNAPLYRGILVNEADCK